MEGQHRRLAVRDGWPAQPRRAGAAMTDTPQRTPAPHPIRVTARRVSPAVSAGPAPDADRVFAALADPRRRELLELLGQMPGCSASSLAARLPVSRQAVAQHLAVLEGSRLVSRRRAGREVLFSVRPEGLAFTADWLTGRAAAWQERLERLERGAQEALNGLPPPIAWQCRWFGKARDVGDMGSWHR
jgi:DNA-binding transcriptional ArsR family regulator